MAFQLEENTKTALLTAIPAAIVAGLAFRFFPHYLNWIVGFVAAGLVYRTIYAGGTKGKDYKPNYGIIVLSGCCAAAFICMMTVPINSDKIVVHTAAVPTVVTPVVAPVAVVTTPAVPAPLGVKCVPFTNTINSCALPVGGTDWITQVNNTPDTMELCFKATPDAFEKIEYMDAYGVHPWEVDKPHNGVIALRFVPKAAFTLFYWSGNKKCDIPGAPANAASSESAPNSSSSTTKTEPPMGTMTFVSVAPQGEEQQEAPSF